ncbi:MAG: hypothetical protein ACE15F_23345, partial [bacterium]
HILRRQDVCTTMRRLFAVPSDAAWFVIGNVVKNPHGWRGGPAHRKTIAEDNAVNLGGIL